jgi:hypothetical protein
VLGLALTAGSGCAVLDRDARTAYCQPGDPVVAPQVVTPGGELRVETVGSDDGVGCESSMPANARYEVRITSVEPVDDPEQDRYTEVLGSLDPSDDGDAEGAVRIPDDVPVGAAEVSLSLQGAPTVCETDPTIGCAKNPFVPIEVTDRDVTD